MVGKEPVAHAISAWPPDRSQVPCLAGGVSVTIRNISSADRSVVDTYLGVRHTRGVKGDHPMRHILTTPIRYLIAADFGVRYEYKERYTLVLIWYLGLGRYLAEIEAQCRRWHEAG